MERLNTFVDLLRKKGCRPEVHDIDDSGFKKIGFTYGRHVWHWVKWTTLISTGEEYFSFDHSYSQVNGKTKKGVRYRIRMASAIRKRFGLEL